MKRLIIILILLMSWQGTASAIDVHIGADLGLFRPENDLVTETFDEDFYFDLFLGIEGDAGFELLLGIGQYSDVSHHPLDEGFDAEIRITPLYVDLVYNFLPQSTFTPYVGAGVGAYFYHFGDNVVSTIDKDTVFAPNIVAGLKFNLTDRFFIKTQYMRHFIPSIPEGMFSGNPDFHSSAFTLAFGFTLGADSHGRGRARAARIEPETYLRSDLQTDALYPYTEAQERLLVRIQQTENQLDEKRLAAQRVQQEIDALQRTAIENGNPDSESDGTIAEIELKKIKLERLEKEIAGLEATLDDLNDTWRAIADDHAPVRTHIIYILDHCRYSPWGLRCLDGRLYYPWHDPYDADPPPGWWRDGDDAYNRGPSVDQRLEETQRRKDHSRRYKNRKKGAEPLNEDQPKAPKPAQEKAKERPSYQDRKHNETEPEEIIPPQPEEPPEDNRREHLKRYQNRTKS